MKNKKHYVRLLLTAPMLICIFILTSCFSDQNANGESSTHGSPVQITNPVKADINEYINFNATTFFLNKQVARSTFQGFIEKLYKNIGDEVKTGDNLFLVKTKEMIGDNNLNIKVGDKQFTGTVIFKAKVDGILTQLNYHVGDFISEGEDIATISTPSSLRIKLNVPYQYVSQILQSSPCIVQLPDGNTFNSTIQNILPSVDQSAQTQTFILNPEKNISLPENLNVTVHVLLESVGQTITLPKNVILSNETLDKFWVMKLINDSTAVRVEVKKGIENDSLVQIIAPNFELTDQIISEGGYGLPDTAKVSIGK